MKTIATTLLLWSIAIGAAVEATKLLARLADSVRELPDQPIPLERYTDAIEDGLALLPFAYGGLSGALAADLLARLLLQSTGFVDEATMQIILDSGWQVIGGGLLLGLLVGGASAGAYKASKDVAPRTIKSLLDWWR